MSDHRWIIRGTDGEGKRIEISWTPGICAGINDIGDARKMATDTAKMMSDAKACVFAIEQKRDERAIWNDCEPYLTGSDFDIPPCPKEPERRYRMLHCDPRLIVMLLNWCRNPMQIVGLPNPENPIPTDAEVVSVNSCWERRCIDVIISHPSFDVVPNGMRIPDFNTEWCVKEQLFRVTEDGKFVLQFAGIES